MGGGRIETFKNIVTLLWLKPGTILHACTAILPIKLPLFTHTHPYTHHKDTATTIINLDMFPAVIQTYRLPIPVSWFLPSFSY